MDGRPLRLGRPAGYVVAVLIGLGAYGLHFVLGPDLQLIARTAIVVGGGGISAAYLASAVRAGSGSLRRVA